MAARKTARKPAARKTVGRAKRRPTSRARKAGPAPVTPGPGQRLWLLDVPFPTRPAGAVFDRARKTWVYPGDALPDHLKPYQSQQYSRLRWLEDDINGAPGPELSGVAPKTPRPIQRSGADAIAAAAKAGAPGFLLTDDVGTGKTITMWLGALKAARILGAARVLITVDRPAAITIPHWRDTIASVGDGGLRVLIASPDSLPKLLARNGQPAHRFDIVVADEAHLYRNTETRRTRTFHKLARFGGTNPPFLIAATATPAQHPAELTYLAPLFAHLHREPASAWINDFGARLTNAGLPIERGPYGKWVWDGRAENSPRMQEAATRHVHGWLASNRPPLTLHRAAPWGPAPLDLMPVQLDPQQQAAYLTAWSQFQQAMKTLSGQTAGDARAKRRAVRDGRAAVLRFRQKASLLRVPATVDWAAGHVENGRQVAISCQFVGAAAQPIADALEDAGISVARLYGSQPGRDPETERLRFQTGAAKAVVFTPTASISLHANEQLGDGTRATSARRVGLMHNVRYSGLAGRQILGRTHRDHQVCPWWLSYCDGTVETRVAATMIGRFKAAADTAGADSGALARVAALLGASWLPADDIAADS